MEVKYIAILLISIGNFQIIHSEDEFLQCLYTFISGQYTCVFSIHNPNGLNNFREINGTHNFGRTDTDVVYIQNNRFSISTTKNIPSIICEKFVNLQIVELRLLGIEYVDEYSFKYCRNATILDVRSNLITHVDEISFQQNSFVRTLYLQNNPISNLSEKTFENLQNLRSLHLFRCALRSLPDKIFQPLQSLTFLDLGINQLSTLKLDWFEPLEKLNSLYLDTNQIQELPENIFKSMRRLSALHLSDNILRVIHSDSFSFHPDLNLINFSNNRIEAIDERLVDVTGVTWLEMNHNLCANGSISDNSVSREAMREALKTCFENYELLLSDTTSTTVSPETSTPHECKEGFIDERVCRLEHENLKLYEIVQELRDKDAKLMKIIQEQQNTIEELKGIVHDLIKNP